MDANNIPVACYKNSIKQGYTWRQWLVHIVGKGPCGDMSIFVAVDNLYLKSISQSLSQETRTYVKTPKLEKYLMLSREQKRLVYGELLDVEIMNNERIAKWDVIYDKFYPKSSNRIQNLMKITIQKCHLCFVTIIWLVTSLLPQVIGEKIDIYKNQDPEFFPGECLNARRHFRLEDC